MTIGNEAGKNQSIDGINLKTSQYLLTHALHLHAHHLDTMRKKNLRVGRKRGGFEVAAG